MGLNSKKRGDFEVRHNYGTASLALTVIFTTSFSPLVRQLNGIKSSTVLHQLPTVCINILLKLILQEHLRKNPNKMQSTFPSLPYNLHLSGAGINI
jgi:hypothetical protein